MKEIGGYIELDTYHHPMLHEDAIQLNCGRNCLAYLFKSRGIKRIKVPFFICDSIINICDREGVEKKYYHIGLDFKPVSDLQLENDEWLYLVNYYGQLSNDVIKGYIDRYDRVIVDQANGYFEDPLPHIDTLYTCRKWFGVSDGALLYTDTVLNDELPQDESYNRMRFLLGRYERNADEFYNEYTANNAFFRNEPVKKMSKLTYNLLHGIDYGEVKKRRKENFEYLHERLHRINHLSLQTAMFMYPLMIKNGSEIRKRLQTEKIYIPILWPTVFNICTQDDVEYKMSENILPLPIDQRYDISDMEYLTEKIFGCMDINH